MRGAVLKYLVNGHDVEFGLSGRYVCQDCGATLLSAMQFATVECRRRTRNAVDPLADERTDVLARFTAELTKATGDGSRKRQAGIKPPWYDDDSHAAAMYRHLERWEAGEKHDPDHEAHPLVAAAWRCLAIACKESGNVPNG